MATVKQPQATSDQKKAWSFYGVPKRMDPARTGASPGTAIEPGRQVGEVRFVIGWMADQMVRMGWRVAIQGSESWTIVTEDGKTIVSNAEQDDVESDEHPANASRRLLEQIAWNQRTVREVTTNLFVAGELHYALDRDTWRVVSVIRPDRDEILSRSTIRIRGIWPHPADPEAPDAPLFGVLTLLDDMHWLNCLSRSQSANRAGMRGIVGVSDALGMANGGTTEQFWADFEASLSRPMDDPGDVAPVGIRGATELVKPEGSGMAGLSWVIPNFPYDDKIDQRMEKLVQRLAYGLPIPPEILLGMQAQSKATAFQVESNSYRAHIEPVAVLVAQIATDTLQGLLPDTVGSVEVIPDPTAILARRHSVSDVLEAFDRGAANFDYLREVLGIPGRAKMTDEDIELLKRIKQSSSTTIVDGLKDPATISEQEPVSAAATMPQEAPEQGPEPSRDDEYLADLLHRIDMAATHELIGASAQAITKARERLGAAVRSNSALKSQCPKDLPNDELATKIGRDNLEKVGIEVDKLINAALSSTLYWWDKRLAKAQADATALLTEFNVQVEYDQTRTAQSVEQLAQTLRDGVFSATAAPTSTYRSIIESAGS